MERFAGVLSLPEGLSTTCTMEIAEGRVRLLVNAQTVGEWPLAELRVLRDGERFLAHTPEGERFDFSTVWADQLDLALHPPSLLAEQLIHGRRQGGRMAPPPLPARGHKRRGWKRAA
jgi:hypothetical protein